MGGKGNLRIIATRRPTGPIHRSLAQMPKIAAYNRSGMVKRLRTWPGNEISRVAQDEFIIASHHEQRRPFHPGVLTTKSPQANAQGRSLYRPLVRGDTSVGKLAKLRPVFARSGTLTAGNSSSLTDGVGGASHDETRLAR